MNGQVSTQSPENGAAGRSDVFDIAITGIGIVTPLGVGCSVNVDRLLAGDSAITHEIPRGVESCGAIASARCPDFDLGGLLRFPKSIKYMSRPVQLAMRAAIEAFESSGLERSRIDPYRLAIYTASGQTGLDYTDFSRAIDFAWGTDKEPDFGVLGGLPTKLIDPYFSLRTLGNGGMALLSTEFGAKGPSGNFVHSETAPALALQAACADIAEGRCDAAIVGGFDSLLHPTSLFALTEAGVLTGDTAHFPQMAPAEGAAFFILERRADALQRGADMVGEILGIECSLEAPARNREQFSGRGIRRLVRRLPAMCQSFQFAVSPGNTPRGIVENVLGEMPLVSSPLVSSMTRATGYLGAATAAVELALGLLSARQGLAPSVMAMEESNGGLAIYDEPSAVIETLDPTGIFFSRSWTGQMAAIVARAYSAAGACYTEGKVYGACAP
jgi:3-oxoacyl-[acyl-carrier-protein] synthase II